jgi:hypothetical protein
MKIKLLILLVAIATVSASAAPLQPLVERKLPNIVDYYPPTDRKPWIARHWFRWWPLRPFTCYLK